jgi:ABC-type transport system involved in multi-copper enzyme maturation permease subunit
MKAKNVLVLVGKDLRMSRWVLAISLGIWVLPILLTTVHMVISGANYYYDRPIEHIMERSSEFCILLAFLVIPAIVGYILAAEGADRSAMFLAYMPFSRLEALVSKAISATAMTLLFLGLNILLTTIMLVWLQYRAGLPNATQRILGNITSFSLLGVAVFGAAWTAAVCFRSVPIAMVVGLGLPLALYTYFVAYYMDSLHNTGWGYLEWSAMMGVVCFIVGVVVFMKRKPEA